MQFNLVGIQAAQGDDHDEARWLEDLAQALTDRGKRVDWWSVSGEQGANPSSAPNVATTTGDVLESGESPTSGAESPSLVVHRAVEVWQAASTMLQTHLRKELRVDGEVAVVGRGWEVAPVLLALDQLLRAEQVRDQVLLAWLAPASLRAEPQPARALDWERLKRACSIIAPNPTVRQELIAERVGSIVIERGADGARWLSARSDRRSLGQATQAEKRGVMTSQRRLYPKPR